MQIQKNHHQGSNEGTLASAQSLGSLLAFHISFMA